ncbi:hypothetical protein IG631_20561 [Alternaria alternata]|nr:hypothetical protein IG631_20561 [Alternaria alternata]
MGSVISREIPAQPSHSGFAKISCQANCCIRRLCTTYPIGFQRDTAVLSTTPLLSLLAVFYGYSDLP